MIGKLEQPKYALYGAFLIAYSMMFLISKPQDSAVFLLWIVSILVLVIRLRFDLSSNYIHFDLLFYIVFSIYNPAFSILAIPTIMLAIYKKESLIITYIGLVLLLIISFQIDYLILFIGYWFVASVLQRWNQERIIHTEKIDYLRNKTYKSEQEKQMILSSTSELSRISVLSERDRIAQTLHDNLGHELTGALLALRAYETLQKEHTENKSFSILKNRLEEAVAVLQDTVSKTKPEETYGYEKVKEVVKNSILDNIDFMTSGDITTLTETHFYFLTSIIKEGLTNVSKHANASYVQIQLRVEKPIIRVKIQNDGVLNETMNTGFGLQYMRKRIEAIGGTLTYNKSNTFTLICVLPYNLEQEMEL